MTPTDRDLEALALTLGRALEKRGWRLSTAESCTGGWIAKAVTDVAGSSNWFDGGIVAYSNAAKIALLGVPSEVLATHGAVSEATVCAMAEGARRRFSADLAVAVSGVAGPGGCAMAEGARRRFSADLAVAVSGVAGPGGGTADKPVGLVHFAWAAPGGVTAARRMFAGNRESVRRLTVALALERLLEIVAAGA